ncbi:Pro-kumamolisin [Thozetella sp. PMI_491]|nr:Pro-kumamolisin [Thozetella sp. PMI_491]
MRFNVFTSILATLAVAADAKPLRRSTRHIVHEESPVGRRHWSRSSRLHHEAILPVQIGLTQSNLHRAEEFIMDVSHPSSPNYGKHWTPDQIRETFAPKQETVDLVKEWLELEGIHPTRTRLANGRNWINFNATVREMERLLKTTYHVYKHDYHGNSHVACDKYHVPEHLAEHIDIITPTIHFDQRVGHDKGKKQVPLDEDRSDELRKRALPPGPGVGILGDPNSGSNPKQGATVVNALMNLDQCDMMITPECLRALYATPPGTLSASNNTMGIVEYTPQAFLQSDLDLFFRQFQNQLVGKPPIVSLVANGVVQQTNKSFNFNGESALDLEFAMTLIFPQQATLYQVGDLVQGASFNNFLSALDGSFCQFQGGNSKDPNLDGQYSTQVGCGTFQATNVISTSYSYNEADLSSRYEQRQCAEYMKMGLQGVTVLYSSGDFGVAGNGGACVDSVTGAYNNGSTGIFNPSFPGSCPYITSVGATEIINGSTVHTPESACETVIFSGGGFSNVFEMPSYQKTAIANYFANSAPPYGQDRFNNSKTVRGFPDVSANGANYVTAVDGNFSLSFGTSASAPTFGAIINLINEKRIEAGKSPVGFINPALYANPQVLNDVTNGKNPGCGTNGFEAVPGWDPVTGLGTPNYPQMEKLFLSLQ